METETYRQFTNTALNQGFNIEQTDRYRQQAQQGGLSSDAYVELRDKPDLKSESKLSSLNFSTVRLN